MRILILSLMVFSTVGWADCSKGQLCQLDIPGAQCADGSQSYINYIDRDSENLFIYVQGGGACFDAVTCGCRLKEKKCKGSNEGGEGSTVGYLSRPPMNSQIHPWSQSENNPIGKANYVEIVYCTGDVYTGAGIANYGAEIFPRLVRHYGAKNFELSLFKAKALFPNVKKVVVIGASAGGVGGSYNLHHIVENFGDTNLSVINDSGIPIFSRYLDLIKVKQVLKYWNVEDSLPKDLPKDDMVDFEDIYKYNSAKYGSVRFALLGATEDVVIGSYFSLLGGKSDAVAQSLQEAATLMERAFEHHYFYDVGKWHVATFLSSWGMPKTLLPQSHGINVEDWIELMVSGSKDWRDLSAD